MSEIKTCEDCGRQHNCLTEEERKAAEANRAERRAEAEARFDARVAAYEARQAAGKAGA